MKRRGEHTLVGSAKGNFQTCQPKQEKIKIRIKIYMDTNKKRYERTNREKLIPVAK